MYDVVDELEEVKVTVVPGPPVSSLTLVLIFDKKKNTRIKANTKRERKILLLFAPPIKLE